jgi:hypothetical protein
MLQLCYWLECGNVNKFSLHTLNEETGDMISWQNYNFLEWGVVHIMDSVHTWCMYLVITFFMNSTL